MDSCVTLNKNILRAAGAVMFFVLCTQNVFGSSPVYTPPPSDACAARTSGSGAGVPQNVKAVQRGNSIYLSWNPVPDAASYRICRYENYNWNALGLLSSSNATTSDVLYQNSVPIGTILTYFVFAQNGRGETQGDSAPISVTVASASSTAQNNVDNTVQDDDFCLNLTYSMSYGSSDRATEGQVTKLQNFLVAFEYLRTQPTGYFGTLTRDAVKEFQREHGIDPIGIVGRLTREAIRSVSCSNPNSEEGGTGTGPNTVTPVNPPTNNTSNNTSTRGTSGTDIPVTRPGTQVASSGSCQSGMVAWVDSNSITAVQSGVESLVACFAMMDSGAVGSERSVQAGSNASQGPWIQGSGSARFTCQLRNGSAAWVPLATSKSCIPQIGSGAPTNQIETTSSVNTRGGSSGSGVTNTTTTAGSGSGTVRSGGNTSPFGTITAPSPTGSTGTSRLSVVFDASGGAAVMDKRSRVGVGYVLEVNGSIHESKPFNCRSLSDFTCQPPFPTSYTPGSASYQSKSSLLLDALEELRTMTSTSAEDRVRIESLITIIENARNR